MEINHVNIVTFDQESSLFITFSKSFMNALWARIKASINVKCKRSNAKSKNYKYNEKKTTDYTFASLCFGNKQTYSTTNKLNFILWLYKWWCQKRKLKLPN